MTLKDFHAHKVKINRLIQAARQSYIFKVSKVTKTLLLFFTKSLHVQFLGDF